MVNRYANGPEELDENGQGPYVLATDYEKLEAENATATHQIESLANQCQFQAERLVALEAEANDHCRASLAANATLDRLREVVNKWMEFDGFTAYDVMDAIRPILYPTPENDND